MSDSIALQEYCLVRSFLTKTIIAGGAEVKDEFIARRLLG